PVLKAHIGQGATVTAGGNVDVQGQLQKGTPSNQPSDAFTPSTAVDSTNDTIKFGFPLNTGDTVAYSPPAGDALVDGLQPFQFTVSQPTFTRAANSASNDTISRSDGRTWTADGVRDGTQFVLTNAVASTNNGLFTVQSVSADGKTLTLT